MGKLGIIERHTEVVHCQHCNPKVLWAVNTEGEPPHLMYKGFPPMGQIILSKNTVVVTCDKCSEQLDVILKQMSAHHLQV